METTLKKVNMGVFNNKPMVVIPVRMWDKMQSEVMEMKENLAMYASENYKKGIARARASKKSYSSSQARKKLGL